MNKEFIGKLPPGGAEQLELQLRELRDPEVRAQLAGIEILPGPGCALAMSQEGKVYSLDDVPKLPFLGCSREPCCACGYLPVMK